MTDTQDPKPRQKPQQNKPIDKLAQQRAQNLRDNLLKRKIQARARQTTPENGKD